MSLEIEKSEKLVEIGKGKKKRSRIGRLRKSEEPLGSNVRLYNSTWEILRQLDSDANKNGPKRVLARDIIDRGIRKIVESDLEGIRKQRATIRDQFNERLKEFQSGQSGATEEMFLAHLLGLSGTRSINQN